jgi:hypothetical protein
MVDNDELKIEVGCQSRIVNLDLLIFVFSQKFPIRSKTCPSILSKQCDGGGAADTIEENTLVSPRKSRDFAKV